MFKKALKKNLIAGLLVTIPAALTYIVLSFVITRVDSAMKPVITGVLGFQNIKLMEEWHIPGMGFLFLVLFIIGVGLIGTNFIGKKVVTFIRQFKKFYPAEDYHQDYYQENFMNYLLYKKACGREKTLKKINETFICAS